MNGGQVAPHIVRRLKIKRAKSEKRHRLQTTDMTSLACQILLLARNGSRYFYRSFFYFFIFYFFPLHHANRTARIHHTAESMESLPSFLHNVYFCPSSYTFNEHFNTPRIIHPPGYKIFPFSFSREGNITHREWEQGEKRRSEFVQRRTRSESSHNFASYVPFWTDAKFQIFYLNLMIFVRKYFKNIFPRIISSIDDIRFSSILEARKLAWKRREKLENIF